MQMRFWPTVWAMVLVSCSGEGGQDPRDRQIAGDDTRGISGSADPGPADSGLQSKAASARFMSAYTDFDLAYCAETSRAKEGHYVTYRCPGRDGVALFVEDGDGRFDIDAGVADEAFESMGAFNYPGDRIEWRYESGKLVAVIYRLHDAREDARDRSALFVARPGSDGQPGCTIAQIAGENANEQARRIADMRAATFACYQQKLQVIGDAS